MKYSELPAVKTVALDDEGIIVFGRSVEEKQPIIVKGAAKHWPLVEYAYKSDAECMAFLSRFYSETPLTMFVGTAEMKGRFSYNTHMNGFNFNPRRAMLSEIFELIEQAKSQDDSEHFYVGSKDIGLFFPGLSETLELPLEFRAFESSKPPIVSVWLGNQTTAAAHYDMSNNIAVCAAGRRRFTLFPPEQVSNLYPGPLEPTPGGQVISTVDFESPDFERHPGFQTALDNAMVAELEPGDLLYYPALWWHQVEGLDDFNVLINYWWNQADEFMDTPMITLLHGILSLRDRSDQEKQAWRELFDYYIFGDTNLPRNHIPDHARGPLSKLDAATARRLRGQILKKINR